MADWKEQMAALSATIQELELALEAERAAKAALQAELEAERAVSAALTVELAEFRALPVVKIEGDTIVHVVPPPPVTAEP